MEDSGCKRRRLDDEGEISAAVHAQNTLSNSEPNDLPLPIELVERVTSFLGGYGGSFGDRVRVAAVCRQLRTAVIDNMRRMGERYLYIEIKNDHILIGGIRVENDLLPPNDQMECMLALMAFGQPTQLFLMVVACQQEGRRLIDIHRILSSVSSLSITQLRLNFHIGQFSGQTMFNDIMEVIGSMTNLETLFLYVRCEETPASLAHRNNLPSVPDDSPFNHLLKLERLCGLAFRAAELVSLKQQADLINRSPSTINHLCYMLTTFVDNETMLTSMNAVVRANITSACCWGVHWPIPLLLLTNLPNCQSIGCLYSSYDPFPTRQKIGEMAGDLLTDCHNNDDRRGKTLQLKIGLWPNKLHEYLANGGQTEVGYNREQTVVSVTVGLWSCVNDADCPFKKTNRKLVL